MNKLSEYTSLRKALNDVALNELPYIQSLADSYDAYKKNRIHKFLTTLSEENEAISPGNTEKLESIINSDEGRELLSSFAHNALNSPSLLVSYALAMIYSHYASGKISELDAKFFCSAIYGMDDYMIDAFVSLSELPSKFPARPYGKNPPYDVAIISKEFIDQHDDLDLSYSVEELFTIANQLINRRLFLPDYTFDRPTGGHWTVIFGLNPKANILLDVFLTSIRR